MPEAITKYAINSTLGTEEFKPLDKIITDGKSLISSDNLYYQIFIGEKYINGYDDVKTFKIPKKIKFNLNGTINLKYYLYNSSDRNHAVLELYKNNVLYKSLIGTPQETLRSQLIEVNKKDEFYFILKNTSPGGDNNSHLKDLCFLKDF